MISGHRLHLLVFSLIVILAGIPTAASAQDEGDLFFFPQDTLRPPMSRLIPLPVLFYTPETKLAGGFSVMYYFRTRAEQLVPSLLAPTFIYTQRGQIIAELLGDTYLAEATYRLNGNIHFVRFPDTFYGIGNDPALRVSEPFTPQRFGFDANFQRLVSRHVRAGATYMFTQHRLTSIEEGGQFESGFIPGTAGGITSGLGLSASWDSRDNAMAPYRGAFHQASATVFNALAGSDYDFVRLRVDLRQYVPTAPRHVLAFQLYSQLAFGDVPFYHMALLGGQNLMRGYHAGSYRDRHMVVAQAEYRMPLWWRFGGVAFAGIGDVYDDENFLDPEHLKYSLGGGLRFLMDDADRMSLRMDYGFGRGTRGFYFTITEAF